VPLSGMGDLEDLFEPGPENENENTPWRLRSRVCAVSDIIGAAAGISLYAVVGIDSVASWPSNQVLISEPDLSTIAGVLLIPTWVWLIFSAGMASGRTQSWRLSQLPTRPRICLVAGAAVCAAVVAGGFVLGAAKGSARILPGPRYQVSLIDPNPSAWTTVPLRQFHLWQASFVREDGPLMVFGLVAATGFIALLHLHREATRASL
jgi:hypothetical protein